MQWTWSLALSLVALAARADDLGLIVRWKLAGGADDSSGHGHNGRAVAVDWSAPGPDGRPRGAARFDGKSSFVEVPPHPGLELGRGDFTLTAWAHTEASLDDVVGDLVSKYDPVARRGLNWCIKSGAGATNSQANERNVHFGIDAGTEPIWTDRGRPGNAVYVMAMAVHDGKLFVGTCEAGPGEAGHVYRYDGDTRRIDCGSPDRSNAVTSLATFDGRLYAGTGRYHPRATTIPPAGVDAGPEVLVTIQKHLRTSDHYSGLSVLTTPDLGRTWTGPEPMPELGWVREPGGVDVAVADVTPLFHPRSGKVLAVGAQVHYSPQGAQLEDRPRSNQTAYAAYDPKTRRWTPWRRLEMPSFDFARSACAQSVVEADGSVLLPLYIARSADAPYSVTVARCAFDGDALTYREHGDVLALDVVRGLCEPSLAHLGGRYFLTIRNDLKGYVAASGDGLHFEPAKPWTFDDGADLGSYNTQQHWLTHGGGLFLVYTRRGADNDHVMRHRAPLFIARVDPERLRVIRATERVLIPERGAELGNFGASAITDRESWVTVAEGVWDDGARRRGAKGAVFAARILWEDAEPDRD